jgi:hypothetical protein
MKTRLIIIACLASLFSGCLVEPDKSNIPNATVNFYIDVSLSGTGDILTTISDNFSVINDWTTNNQPAIKIGNTTITETQLAKLIAFIDSIEEVTE